MTDTTKQPTEGLSKPKKAPSKPQAKRSTSGNTTVTPKAKSPQRASQSPSRASKKPQVPKPTIKGLQEEVKGWQETAGKLTEIVTEQEVYIKGLLEASGTKRLLAEIEVLETALDVETNKTWWEITQERFIEALYRAFGRFTSYE